MNRSSASGWYEVTDTADVIAQTARTLDDTARTPVQSAEELAAAREALLIVTAAGKRLARLLDTLALHYETQNLEGQSAVHIALDQAAAAAEDLGNCTKVAAQAIEEQE